MSTPFASMVVKRLFNAEAQKDSLTGLQIYIINQLIDTGPGGMTTRQIADLCNISIYTARHELLKLELCAYIKKEHIVKGYRWIYIIT